MLPTITWSTCSPSTPERERTSWPTVAPRSVAGTSLSAPPKVPIPVLKGVEMTISPLPLPLPKLMVLLPLRFRGKEYIKRQGPEPGEVPGLSGFHVKPFFTLLPCALLGLVQATPVVREHRVEEVHVGVHRLLGEGLGSLLLLALLLDQVLRQSLIALSLAPEVVDHAVEEVLGQLGVELLRRNPTLGQRLIELLDRLGEPIGRLVYLLLLFLVHNLFFCPSFVACLLKVSTPHESRLHLKGASGSAPGILPTRKREQARGQLPPLEPF